MSGLIFNLHPEQVVVATDTLATAGGEPVFFTSKAYYLPHLRMIMAGTGYGKFVADWFLAVNTGYLAVDVEELALHAPHDLRQRWVAYQRENPDAIGSTTVYHFGVSEKTGRMVTFAFRSTADFTAERLPEFGTAHKPSEGVPGIENFSMEVIPEVMEAMRTAQAKEADPTKRIHVGGEIVVFVLSPQGFQSGVIYRFADADENDRRARATLGQRHG